MIESSNSCYQFTWYRIDLLLLQFLPLSIWQKIYIIILPWFRAWRYAIYDGAWQFESRHICQINFKFKYYNYYFCHYFSVIWHLIVFTNFCLHAYNCWLSSFLPFYIHSFGFAGLFCAHCTLSNIGWTCPDITIDKWFIMPNMVLSEVKSVIRA